jgi:hypothetical protein
MGADLGVDQGVDLAGLGDTRDLGNLVCRK